ncbi:MAG: A/G-specific adenine glycosylase [Gemmatimonadales bacterium]|jgi:A/G-specific adenine glycosylase|nr:A/G-specific adenine glycosylase [Gemmatimonadales bacterium]
MSGRLPRNALAFKRRLLRWFRTVGRDLPWRRTRDPYRVLVSEFMLQQTQVKRVSEFYPRFLQRFPTIEDLAAARPHQVRGAWDGLGYYRRAANLHRLARTLVREHDATIPSRPADLETLPGVGRYTAGAVASFAYERRVPAVDTNVARVLARVFRPGRRTRAAPTDRTLWDLAERLLPTRRRAAWEFNQALMDLGARYCVARSPKCEACPVRPVCRTGKR